MSLIKKRKLNVQLISCWSAMKSPWDSHNKHTLQYSIWYSLWKYRNAKHFLTIRSRSRPEREAIIFSEPTQQIHRTRDVQVLLFHNQSNEINCWNCSGSQKCWMSDVEYGCRHIKSHYFSIKIHIRFPYFALKLNMGEKNMAARPTVLCTADTSYFFQPNDFIWNARI